MEHLETGVQNAASCARERVRFGKNRLNARYHTENIIIS